MKDLILGMFYLVEITSVGTAELAVRPIFLWNIKRRKLDV